MKWAFAQSKEKKVTRDIARKLAICKSFRIGVCVYLDEHIHF
jgi:hypothetical protein